MKKTMLNKNNIIKLRKSLVLFIIAIFLAFNLFSVIIFTYYVRIEEANKNLDYAKDSLQEIVNEKSELISIRFDRIATNVKVLGGFLEEAVNEERTITTELPSDYTVEQDGAIKRTKKYTINQNEYSNVLAKWNEDTKETILYDLAVTEKMDSIMETIIDNEEVIWGYIVTKNNFLRVCPYMNLDEYFDVNHDQTKDIFYTTANSENNPSRKAIITKPYNDYLGKGWTVTYTQPVYDSNDEMYGIVCLDISLETIKEEFLQDFSLGETGEMYLVNSNGSLYYHSKYDEKSNIKGEIFEKNIFELEDIGKEEKETIKYALENESGIKTFTTDEGPQILVFSKIDDIDSTLVIKMSMHEFEVGESLGIKQLIVLLSLDIIIALVFILILYYKFSKPMKELVERANRISDGDYSNVIDEDAGNYYEIKSLNKAFSTMNKSIEEYTETLIEKNKELNTIIGSVETTLMIVDIDGTIGICSKEVTGVSDEHLKSVLCKLKREKEVIQESLILDDEAYENVYYPIFNDKNEVVRAVVSSECITEKLLMDQEIKQIEKMAGVGQLSAAIVHELKNKMARIKGEAYILQLRDSDKANSEEIEDIFRAVEEAENVITTLLDFSRNIPTKTEIPNTLEINTIINQILLLSRKEMISKNIKVDLKLDENCYIYSDETESIKVILQNIIINAIQAIGEEGTIAIRLNQSSDEVYISIEDNGKGIPHSMRNNIFKPFFTTREKGNGIGLWITKRLVDSMGGEILLKRTDESGTEFQIILPKRKENHGL